MRESGQTTAKDLLGVYSFDNQFLAHSTLACIASSQEHTSSRSGASRPLSAYRFQVWTLSALLFLKFSLGLSHMCQVTSWFWFPAALYFLSGMGIGV